MKHPITTDNNSTEHVEQTGTITNSKNLLTIGLGGAFEKNVTGNGDYRFDASSSKVFDHFLNSFHKYRIFTHIDYVQNEFRRGTISL